MIWVLGLLFVMAFMYMRHIEHKLRDFEHRLAQRTPANDKEILALAASLPHRSPLLYRIIGFWGLRPLKFPHQSVKRRLHADSAPRNLLP
jgi:hypothetical protein